MEWHAPIPMQIVRIPLAGSKGKLRPTAEALRWSPVEREGSARSLIATMRIIKDARDRAATVQSTSQAQSRKDGWLFKASLIVAVATPFSTHFVSTPFAVLGSIIATTFGIKTLTLWKRSHNARHQATLSSQHVDEHSKKLRSIEDQLKQLADRATAMRWNVASAISEFEAECLSLSNVVTPFTWLPRAEAGDWVVASSRLIDFCEKKVGVTITVSGGESAMQIDSAALFRVQDRGTTQINLNRDTAYYPVAA